MFICFVLQVPTSRSRKVLMEDSAVHFQTIPEEPVELPKDRQATSNSSVKSIKSNTLVPSPSKEKKAKATTSPLYACVGTRKNLLQLTSDQNILNTPTRKAAKATESKRLRRRRQYGRHLKTQFSTLRSEPLTVLTVTVTMGTWLTSTTA